MVKILFTIGQDGNFMAVNQAQLISITRWICLLLFVWLFTGCSDSEMEQSYPASESRQEIFTARSPNDQNTLTRYAPTAPMSMSLSPRYMNRCCSIIFKTTLPTGAIGRGERAVARYYDAKGNLLPEEIDSSEIDISEYDITIKRRCVTSPILRWHVIATGSISITRWANFRSQH